MAKDTPETVYWCPVCDADVALIDVRKHLEAHYLRCKITGETKEYVDGLRDVAIRVLQKSGIDYYKSRAVVTKKPRYFPNPNPNPNPNPKPKAKVKVKKNARILKTKKKVPKGVRKKKKRPLKQRRRAGRGGHTTKMIGSANYAKSSDWKTVK